MYGCDCHIGCLTGAITRVGGIEQELSGAVTRFGKGLSGYVSMICSVNKERPFWMWDSCERILWENNIEIEL